MRTSLGDQGSQVRVLSPRRARNVISVQGFPVPSTWRIPAGPSPPFTNNDLSSKATISPRSGWDAARPHEGIIPAQRLHVAYSL
jgi:hypothetical protein